MHRRAPAFLIWTSALTRLSRRFICDFISITLGHGYSSQAVVVLVTVAYLILRKRRETSPTYVLPRDSGLRPFSPGSSCFMPADFLPTITPVWSGVT
jgi:hypothetical protein